MKKETLLLKELCEIRTGYQGKKEEGNMYRLINPTDLNADGIIDKENTKAFGNSEIAPKFILKDKEILFKAKSSHYSVSVFNEFPEFNQTFVPSGHFFILNIKDNQEKRVHPEYVSWYLSQEKAQKHFKKMATGMAMATVRKSDLEDLIVTVPPLEIQDKIVEIQSLRIEEKILFERLIELRKIQTENALNSLI